MILECGDTFNDWTYVGRSEKKGYALFRCKCGAIKEVYINSVVRGKSKSCGCCKRNGFGLKKDEYLKIYHALDRARQRCYNRENPSFYTHGARGIAVCDEWLVNPDSFISWAIEHGWKDGLTLDRIDNNGNYEPDNCRWANWETQARNRRSCIYFVHDGEQKCMMEWCEEFGIPHYLAYNRYRRGYRDFDTIFFNGNLNKDVSSNN